jgi:hypothetical protein
MFTTCSETNALCPARVLTVYGLSQKTRRLKTGNHLVHSMQTSEDKTFVRDKRAMSPSDLGGGGKHKGMPLLLLGNSFVWPHMP